MIVRPEPKLTRHERRQKAFVAEMAATLAGERQDDRDGPHPLTWRERLRVAPALADLWFAVTYPWLRDRMRCPRCTAVGTFKMHGTWLERWIWGDINVRRGGCKWCGYWITPAGRFQAFPSSVTKVWTSPGHVVDGQAVEREPTPPEVLYQHSGRTWPWRG